MAALNELSNKKLIKNFAADSSDIAYELELFNRLENNEFSDDEILKICLILIEKKRI